MIAGVNAMNRRRHRAETKSPMVPTIAPVLREGLMCKLTPEFSGRPARDQSAGLISSSMARPRDMLGLTRPLQRDVISPHN
jgi:hypothetical protein